MKKLFCYITLLMLLCACRPELPGHRVVICVPVYGQSLALGEEAERLTDFDSLAVYAGGRIVTENMDHRFGYFDNDSKKQWAKKLIRYQKRAFELSVYRMAQELADHTGTDTLICIFPGGQGATAIAHLSKGTPPYNKFMEDIETAYNTAKENGWDFVLPAVCWMQGESDIADYPDTNYRQLLIRIWQDMDEDIRRITHQRDTIHFICYQPNSLTRAPQFKADNYWCQETAVPQTFTDLLQAHPYFWASGPTYPYACVGEKIHIDAAGQQQVGMLAARSVLDILRQGDRQRGLIPLSTTVDRQDVVIRFNVPVPPLTIDTVQVTKADHYGFSVIDQQGRDIVQDVLITGDSIRIHCAASPIGCKARYAVNGEYMKSGHLHGPRGNIRDAKGHWCYMFDLKL